jgi:hypothetical protein
MVRQSAANKIQMWLAASGLFCVVLYVIGWGIIGMGIPPWIPKASMSPQQFFDFYRDHSSRIMWGMTIGTFAGGLSMAFSCQVSAQMWQREKNGHVLSLVQLIGGVLTGWCLMVGPMAWLGLAEFSTELNPAVVRFFHFVTWYTFDGTYWINIAQVGAIGLMALLDDQETPLFPRWSAGVVGTVLAVSYISFAFIPFDHARAFSYDGLVNMYWDWGTFVLYHLWVSACCVKDLKRKKVGAQPQIRGAEGVDRTLVESSAA